MRLKDLRTIKGVTQKEVARALNTTDDTIYSWEKGRSQPSLEMLFKLADYFDCSIDYLVGREDDFGIVQSSAPNYALTALESEMLSHFRKLDVSAQHKVIGYVYALSH